MKTYYIYKTTNLINNKQYIGKHYGELDDAYIGSGLLLQRAIEKYGIQNFKKEILKIVDTEEQLNVQEKYYIDLFDAINDKNFYNIADGGQGGYVTKGYTDQERLATNHKISIALAGENHPMYGKHHTDEVKQCLREKSLQYWTKEKRQERSEQYTGEGNPMYGKHKSAESIARQIAHTDYSAYRTEEYRHKMSLATSGEKNGNYGNKGEKAKNGRHVLMYDENHNLIKEFNTKRLVLQFLKIKSAETLNKAIREKRLYKGYYWDQI